jgi:hypothetical protein
MIHDITVSRIIFFFVALTGFAVAIYVGNSIGEGRAGDLLLPVFFLVTLIYVVRAGRSWWVPYAAFVAFTGVFWVGFKIYSFELGLMLGLLALTTHLAMGGWRTSAREEGSLPLLAFPCFLFTVFHLLASLYIAKSTGEGGMQNIVRSYSEYLWPLLFLFAFARYGNNDGLPWALNLFLGMFLFRAILSTARIFLPQMEGYLYVPGINFIPMANLEADLRESCLAASYILLGITACQKNWAAKAGWGLLWLAAGLGIVFGGGRVAVPLYALGPLVLAAIYRKWVLLAGTAVVLGTAVAYLNLSPQILDGLPKEAETVRRALSGLIFREDRAGPDEFATGQSDEFHRLLREAGYKKWTEDAASLFVGYPIGKFDYESYDQSVGGQYLHQLKVDAAVATGRYEKGLWIYLAVFGITGFSLYLGLTFCLLARPTYTIWRNGIEDAGGVFGFFAITSMFGWLITSNIKSGNLSPILFTGTFAYFWSLQARTLAAPRRHEEKALPAHALAQYSRQPPSSGPLP